MRRSGRSRTIDFKQWQAVPGIDLSISTATTTLGGGLAFSAPATILRVRCPEVLALFDSTMQANDLAIVTLGLGIVSSDAYAAGAGSMPDPDDDIDYPWVYWTQFRLFGYGAGAGSDPRLYADVASQFRLRDIDSKAMRRVKPGEELAWIVQTETMTGAPVTLVKIATTRVLLGT